MRSDATSRAAQEILDVLEGAFIYPAPEVVSIGVSRSWSNAIVPQDPSALPQTFHIIV